MREMAVEIDEQTYAVTRQLMEPFPQAAIKQRKGGGGTTLDYVEGETVIRRLIRATGNRFNVRVLSVEKKDDLLTAMVEVEIPGLGARQHMGVQKVNPEQRGGEDLAKGCITDAIKKAATLFGVGLELYGPDYEGEIAASRSAYDEFAALMGEREEAGDKWDDIVAEFTAARGKGLGDERLLDLFKRLQDRRKVRARAQEDREREEEKGGDRTSPMTARQRRMIFAVGREAGLEEEELESWAKELHERSIGELNREQASDLIDRLQRRRNEVA